MNDMPQREFKGTDTHLFFGKVDCCFVIDSFENYFSLKKMWNFICASCLFIYTHRKIKQKVVIRFVSLSVRALSIVNIRGFQCNFIAIQDYLKMIAIENEMHRIYNSFIVILKIFLYITASWKKSFQMILMISAILAIIKLLCMPKLH